LLPVNDYLLSGMMEVFMSIRILFACGGTGGHINPALAVAAMMKERHPGAKILFAGNPAGMEARLVPAAGFEFTGVEVLGFQRRPSFHNLKNNIKAVRYLFSASGKVEKIVNSFSPDVCVGTGGYVSGPVVRKAAKMNVRTVTHEQNAYPGVTTKLLCKYADKVLLAVPEAQVRLPKYVAGIVTGNPVRKDVLQADRKSAREHYGIGDRVCLLSFGGSQGAAKVNQGVADVIAWHFGSGKIHHIHATGQYGGKTFPGQLSERGVNILGDEHIDVREFIDDMPRCLAAADLVICRAGALSISELQAAGRASILIPSPNVAANHQHHNAAVLAKKDAAILIEERSLTGGYLVSVIEKLVENPAALKKIGKNAAAMAITDATERICDEIESLL
jgi:UDP-N-acetylglucosamine--N-acetylmuramyl-(pentapeptide) pyrophosphoryl-undecaprenol N-acetylglucosamine transferase